MLSLRANRGVAGSWLSGAFSSQDGTLAGNDREFAAAIALRLGLDVFPLPDDGPTDCPGGEGGCATRGRLDPMGIHALGCTAGRSTRHNRVRDALYSTLSRSLPSSCLDYECTCGPDGSPSRRRRGEVGPGDVVCRLPGGVWSYLDVVVWSPRPDLFPQAALDGRAIHRAAYADKLRHSPGAPAVLASGQAFVPIAAGAYGDIDSRSLVVLRDLGAGVDRMSPLPHGGLPTPLLLRRCATGAVILGSALSVLRLRDAAAVSGAEPGSLPATASAIVRAASIEASRAVAAHRAGGIAARVLSCSALLRSLAAADAPPPCPSA